jgi:two-component system, NarL family, response regulator LiaR
MNIGTVGIDQSKSGKEAIRIIIVDDHALVRQALKIFLEKQPDFKVIAEASNGEEAVQYALNLEPDVVIMDISMPILNGLEATRLIKEKQPNIGVLALTVHTSSEYVLGILEAGAAGYLTKSVFGEDVVQAVRSVAAGEAVLTPAILKQIVSSVPRQAKKPAMLDNSDKLTMREIEILKFAAAGMSNKEIADKLNINIRTVKSYLVGIFSKLRVGSRTEAVMVGLRTGFLTLNDI